MSDDDTTLDAIADLVTEAAEPMLDLYHRTTPEAAESIRRDRSMHSEENSGEAYFSTFRGDEPNAQGTGYGAGVVHVRVPERLAELDDEFPSGEQHYRVDTYTMRPEHFVASAAPIADPPPVHRGISIRLSGKAYDAIHNPAATPEAIANTILSQRSLHRNLGMHWSTDPEIAREYSGSWARTGSSDLPIILHAAYPAPEAIETRPHMLTRPGHEVPDFAKWDKEIPVRKGADMQITGISWRPHEPHPAADADGWMHHDLGVSTPHTAAAVAVDPIADLVSESAQGDDYKVSSAMSPLPMANGTYYRLHAPHRPFSREDASTRNNGEPIKGMEKYWEPKQGYSAFWNPHHIKQYLDEMGWEGGAEGSHVLRFRGKPIGEGADGEPRVMPDSDHPDESIPVSDFMDRLEISHGAGDDYRDHTWGEGPEGRIVDDGYRSLSDGLGKTSVAVDPISDLVTEAAGASRWDEAQSLPLYHGPASAWYHGTREDVQSLPPGYPIHLGTENAAQERLRSIGPYNSKGVIGEPRVGGFEISGPMRNTPQTAVSDELANEMSRRWGPNSFSGEESAPWERFNPAEVKLIRGGHGGIYYRNDTEDKGRVSAVVPGSEYLRQTEPFRKIDLGKGYSYGNVVAVSGGPYFDFDMEPDDVHPYDTEAWTSPKSGKSYEISHFGGGGMVGAHWPMADGGKRLAGALSWFNSGDDHQGEIHKVFVHPRFDREGVATAMLDYARRHFPEDDIHHSQALTDDGKAWSEHTAAMTLYRGEGTHESPSYYPKTGPDALAGAWWTDDLDKATGYAKSTTDGKVYSLDVEDHEAEPRGARGYYVVLDPEVRARRRLLEGHTSAITPIEAPDYARDTYEGESTLRRHAPFPRHVTEDMATAKLQEMLGQHHIPQSDQAFVEVSHGGSPKSSTAWDMGTVPATPGVRLAPGMHDYLTLAHEAAHIIDNHQVYGPHAMLARPKEHTTSDVHDGHFLETYRQLVHEHLHPQAGRRFDQVFPPGSRPTVRTPNEPDHIRPISSADAVGDGKTAATMIDWHNEPAENFEFEDLGPGSEDRSRLMGIRHATEGRIGAVDYQPMARSVRIWHIDSHTPHSGAATRLMDELVRRHPGKKFDPLNLTDSGQAFWDRYTAARPDFKHLGAKISQLNEAMRFASAAEQAAEPDFMFHVQASWADVRSKAQQIRAEGGVRILAWRNGELVGQVRGDTNVYESTIVFVPGSRTTGSWNCSCAWAAYSWGRSGKFRKFEGRRCSHTLALQFEAQSRGMFGKDIKLDVNTPHWLGGDDVVKIPGEYDRDSGGYPEGSPQPKAAVKVAAFQPEDEDEWMRNPGDEEGPFYHGSPHDISGQITGGGVQQYFTHRKDFAWDYATGGGKHPGWIYQVRPTGRYHIDDDTTGFRGTYDPIEIASREKAGTRPKIAAITPIAAVSIPQQQFRAQNQIANSTPEQIEQYNDPDQKYPYAHVKDITGKDDATYRLVHRNPNYGAGNVTVHEKTRNGRYRGVGYLSFTDTPNEDRHEVFKTHVHEDYRRRGLASAMFDFARETHPNLGHSHALTDDGQAFTDATPTPYDVQDGGGLRGAAITPTAAVAVTAIDGQSPTVRMMGPDEYGKLKILDFPKIHDLPSLARKLREDAPEYYQALHDDIAQNGIKVPAVADGDTLVDGHHRLSIAHELGIPAPVGDYNSDEDRRANSLDDSPMTRDWMQKRWDMGAMRLNIMPWMWQKPGDKTSSTSVASAVTPIGQDLDHHLENWFHPQQLDARKEKHPKSGWMVPVGEERRVAHPENSSDDPHGLGPEMPARFDVLDNGPLTGMGFRHKVRTEPIQHVYRGVHEDEWKQAQQRGYLQSDARGAIVSSEGMNAAVDPQSAVSYLPRNASGRVLKIRVQPEDGWFSIKPDSYVRTRSRVPLDRVESFSPTIHKDDRAGMSFDSDEQPGAAHTAAVTKVSDMNENWPPYLTERTDRDGDPIPVNQSRGNVRGPVMTEQDAKAQGWVGPYYHGTTKRRAADIRRGGFRQPRMHNWEMADPGTIEEIDDGNTHRTFFADNPQDAWDHAVGNHGKENAALLKVYLHPDHAETDKGGGFYPSTQVKDVAYAAATPDHVPPMPYTTDQIDRSKLHPDDFDYRPLPGQHSGSVAQATPEAAGLPSAIAYSQQTAQALAGLQQATSVMVDGLRGHEVEGDAVEQLIVSRSHLEAATAGMATVQEALEGMISIRAARDANPGAGSDDFLRGGVLAEHQNPSEKTETDTIVPHRNTP
jgi:GNAT superfamily N-acetyltransferase